MLTSFCRKPSGRSAAWLARLVRDQEVEGSNPFAPTISPRVRPGHIGYTSYRRHRLHFWAKRVVERLQSFFLQIDVAEIVLHKANQPNTFFDVFDPQGLSCEDRAEINFLRCRQMRPQLVTRTILRGTC